MTQQQLFRIGLMVIIAGIILLVVMDLLTFLLPIITPIVLIVLVYLIYVYLKTGKLPFNL